MIHNNFNPRSHERSDTTCDRLARGSYDFNPRSHERSDNIDNQPNQQHTNFNPRSHERSDLINLTINIAASISIPAPTRGATLQTARYLSHQYQFQSTLPREERRCLPTLKAYESRFQSTLPREERRYRNNNHSLQQEFQSTLPREERLAFTIFCLCI